MNISRLNLAGWREPGSAGTAMVRMDVFRSPEKLLRIMFSWGVLVLLCAFSGNGQAAPPSYVTSLLSSYKLAAGDVITIRVFGEDDLSRERIRLSDAGTIPYPVLGEVKALGLTIGEIEKIITSGLSGRYLVNPRVSVTIEEYRPFYINGMVEKPGGYPFQPGLTVLKASSLAGGFKERASFSKISIIREGDTTGKRQKADINSPVNPGDTIFIEESFF